MSIFMKCKHPGEATQQNHRNEIDVQNLSWGAAVAITHNRNRGGRTIGEPTISTVSLTMGMNKAVPKLFDSLWNAENLDKVYLTLVTTGSPGADYCTYTLSGSMVASGTVTRPQGGIASVVFQLSFTKLEFRFTPYDQAGKSLGNVQAGWDFFANKPA